MHLWMPLKTPTVPPLPSCFRFLLPSVLFRLLWIVPVPDLLAQALDDLGTASDPTTRDQHARSVIRRGSTPLRRRLRRRRLFVELILQSLPVLELLQNLVLLQPEVPVYAVGKQRAGLLHLPEHCDLQGCSPDLAVVLLRLLLLSLVRGGIPTIGRVSKSQTG